MVTDETKMIPNHPIDRLLYVLKHTNDEQLELAQAWFALRPNHWLTRVWNWHKPRVDSAQTPRIGQQSCPTEMLNRSKYVR